MAGAESEEKEMMGVGGHRSGCISRALQVKGLKHSFLNSPLLLSFQSSLYLVY